MRKYKKSSTLSGLFIIFVSSFMLISCSKQVNGPVRQNSNTQQLIGNFHLSESRIVLLQGNAANQAILFSWNPSPDKETVYTLEAAIAGSSFADPLQLMSTDQPQLSFSVKDFNSFMSQLLYADQTGRVEFRVSAKAASHAANNTPASLSDAVALDVTTYRCYREYSEPDVFKIPGNYQGWNLACAPQIVSSPGKGEFEGYINFTNPYSQILMVKGNDWEVRNTYTYIGADKFGFGGSVLSVFGGAGVYLFKANTNTNRWSYTKINSWGISGSAVGAVNNGDLVMQAGENNLSWSISTNLAKGTFRIRANNSDAISFGHKSCDDAGVPSYDGDNITIKTAGNYTIKLELGIAGNYAYSIQKNS